MTAVEMAVYYKNIIAALDKIYRKFGYCSSSTFNYEDNETGGDARIAGIMAMLRAGEAAFDAEAQDYINGGDNLPAADILKYRFNDGSIVYIRPSGTEPKLKAYIFAQGRSEAEAARICSDKTALIKEAIEKIKEELTGDQNGREQ